MPNDFGKVEHFYSWIGSKTDSFNLKAQYTYDFIVFIYLPLATPLQVS